MHYRVTVKTTEPIRQTVRQMLPIPYTRRGRSAGLQPEEHASLGNEHRDRKPVVAAPPKKAVKKTEKKKKKKRSEPKPLTWRKVGYVECLRDGEWERAKLHDGEIDIFMPGATFSVIFEADGVYAVRKRDRTMRFCRT